MKDNSSILEVYFQYTSCYLKDTLSILQIYFKYTSSILRPVKLQKKNYTLSLYYLDKRSTFEVHFVKLNQFFLCKLEVYFKCTLSMVKVCFLELYCKYTLRIFQLYFRSILQVYFKKESWSLFRVHLSQWITLGIYSSIFFRRKGNCKGLTFKYQVPRIPWHSLDWPLKNESWGGFSAALCFWLWDLWYGRPTT